MSVTRRLFVSTGAALPLAQSAQAHSSNVFIDLAVERASWTFPQPSSGNTQIGFGLRKRALGGHLTKYAELYFSRFGSRLSAEHLDAAATVVVNQLGWFPQGARGPAFEINETSFGRIWAVAEYRLRRLSAAVPFS